MMKNSNPRRRRNNVAAFTLIEVLIYMAVIGGVMSALVLFALSISNSGNAAYATQEVHANLRFALDIIRARIRAADAVIDVQPSMITLHMADDSENLTIIRLNNGVLELEEGGNSSVALTTGRVTIKNFSVTDLTGGALRENVRIEITGSYESASDQPFTYTQHVEAAVSLRQ